MSDDKKRRRESHIKTYHSEKIKSMSLDNIFEQDTLNYRKSVEKAGELIKNISPPYVLGIYGDWGSGKTSYMDMLRTYIEHQEIGLTEWYNVWKYENEDNAVLPLLSLLSKNKSIKNNKTIKSKFNKVKKISAVATSVAIEAVASGALQSATLGAVDLKSIKGAFKNYEDKAVKIYENWVDNIEAFEKEFKNLVNLITSKDKPLVIFIDDLDRCMPENAINVIESLKHYLTAEGVNCIFIIGVDKKVISKGIEARYGREIIEGGDYLRKIIDFNIYLEPKIKERYIEVYFSNCGVDSIVEKELLRKYSDKFAEIISQTNISIRIANKILDRLVLLLAENKISSLNEEILIKFLTIKELYPEIYNEQRIEKYFGIIPGNTDYLNSYFLAQKDNWILFSCGNDDTKKVMYSMKNSFEKKEKFKSSLRGRTKGITGQTEDIDLLNLLNIKSSEIPNTTIIPSANGNEEDYFNAIDYATSLVE